MPPRSEELPVSPTKRLLSDFVATNEAQIRVKRFLLKSLEESLYGPALKSRIIRLLPLLVVKPECSSIHHYLPTNI